jgi:hypothetical protein
MNKTLLVVLALSSILLSACASGPNPKDKIVTIDGKNITVTDFDESLISSSKKLKNSELKNGVFIEINCLCFSHPEFPNVERSIATIFKEHGIKVADSLAASNKRIRFSAIGAIDLGRAEQAAAYSALPNTGQVVGGGGQLIGAVSNGARSAAGGAGGLVGFAVGALWNSDSKLTFTTSVINSDNGDFFTKSANIFYRLEKGKEASDDVVLKMAVDQWINHFVVFDTPPETPVATAPASPVAQAAPAPALTQ